MIKTKKEQDKFPLEKSFKILGYIFNPTGKSQCRESGPPNAESQQSVVERCTDLQEQRRAVENEAKGWWIKSKAFSALALKIGRGVELLRTRLKDGRK